MPAFELVTAKGKSHLVVPLPLPDDFLKRPAALKIIGAAMHARLAEDGSLLECVMRPDPLDTSRVSYVPNAVFFYFEVPKTGPESIAGEVEVFLAGMKSRLQLK